MWYDTMYWINFLHYLKLLIEICISIYFFYFLMDHYRAIQISIDNLKKNNNSRIRKCDKRMAEMEALWKPTDMFYEELKQYFEFINKDLEDIDNFALNLKNSNLNVKIDKPKVNYNKPKANSNDEDTDNYSIKYNRFEEEQRMQKKGERINFLLHLNTIWIDNI